MVIVIVHGGWATRIAGGGAGNPGGMGKYNGNDWNVNKGEDGTGGLLIIYANNLNNIGKIEANGSNGGKYGTNIQGGNSGGGSINIFCKQNIAQTGNVETNGGEKNGIEASVYILKGEGGIGSISIGNIKNGTYESMFKNY